MAKSISAANDRDQAAIVYKFARQMVELEPELRDKIEMHRLDQDDGRAAHGSVYRAISAEAGTKHGYLPSVVIYDELAQAKSRELYDVLDTSFGARARAAVHRRSRRRSNDPEHIMSKLIDDGLRGIDPTICLPPLRRRRRLRAGRRGAMAQSQPGARRLPRLRRPRDRDPQGEAPARGRTEGPQPVPQSARLAGRFADLARGMDGMRRRSGVRAMARKFISRSIFRAWSI